MASTRGLWLPYTPKDFAPNTLVISVPDVLEVNAAQYTFMIDNLPSSMPSIKAASCARWPSRVRSARPSCPMSPP